MEALVDFVARAWAGLPPAASAPIVVIAGWLLAALVRLLASRLPARLGFDSFCERAGLTRFLRAGKVAYAPSRFLGVLAWWIVMLGALVTAARILDIGLVRSVADAIEGFLPSFIAFVLIVIAGLAIAAFLGNVTLTLARNAGLGGARLASRAVKYAVGAVAVVAALGQLGVAAGVLESLVSISFAAVAFGLALAFGLGCKDLARGAMERFLRNLRESDREGQGADMEG